MSLYEAKGSNKVKIAIYNLLIFIKLLVFHHFIDIQYRSILVSLLNVITSISIFSIANYLFRRRKDEIFMGLYMALTALLFFDSLYYSHFFTLIPINAIYQVGHLGAVSGSVKTLLKPVYFLYFADWPIVLYLYFKNRKTAAVDTRRRSPRQLSWVLLLFLCIFFGNQQVKIAAGGFYTPFNLGTYNYHIYDVYRLFGKTPLVDNVDAWMEILENETPENPIKRYHGLLEGKNIIVIQAESLQGFVLNREVEGQAITPVLNQLISKDTLYFSRYYEQVGWGNTSDAEFVTHNGLHASTINFSYKQYEGKQLFSLPMLLKQEDYETIVFHGNEPDFWNRKSMYPTIGFDQFISSEELNMEEIIGLGLSDKSLFQQSMAYLKQLPKPFYSFYITVTSHYPYVMAEEQKGLSLEKYEDTLLGDYLQTVNYLDAAIGELIEALKREGLYENTAIILYGDHHGLDARNEEINAEVTEFLGKPYQEDEMYRVPMMIHIPQSNLKREIKTVGGQIDFYPTIANLIGLETKDENVLGKDLLNTKEGFAVQQVHTGKGSFINNEMMFIISKDGIFENSKAWHIHTGEPVELEEAREGYERAIAEIFLSEYIIENVFQVSEEEDSGVSMELQDGE